MVFSIDQLAQFQAFADELADAAGIVILDYFRSEQTNIENKGGNVIDSVTDADKVAEHKMREMIQARYPGHGIVGEEENLHGGTCAVKWVLDPIDGTRAFIAGLPLWGTLIALNNGQRPIIGVMNQPFTKERFIGTQDGAWLNGRRLKTRRCDDLGSARVMCASPQLLQNREQRAAFDRVAASAQMVIYGGDCYAYCMLAAGYVDAVIDAGLQAYDVQALIPIIEGAGGVMTTWEGGDAQDGGTVVACGDPLLYKILVNLLQLVA